MKRRGASIIFVNDKCEILLLLRDNLLSIPYPNMWDLPGGHIEEGETPEESIISEMGEELDVSLDDFNLFSVNEFSDRLKYTFWKKMNFDINRLTLIEGQKIRWFTEAETKNVELAYVFNEIVYFFFKKSPII